jgi:hypothetical protein
MHPAQMSRDTHIGWSIVWHNEMSTRHVDSDVNFSTTVDTDIHK